MAQKIQVTLVDDIDGGAGDETIRFSVDGTSYEIDLSSANAARLRGAMAEFVGHARKVPGRAPRRTARRSSDSRSAKIRAWAKAKGIPVNERGRISSELAAKYDAAH